MSGFLIAVNARYETAEEATEAALLRSGKTHKEVATAVFPKIKPVTAYMRLKHGLHPGRAEKLTADEHLRVARFCGEYDFVYYGAHICGLKLVPLVSADEEFRRLSDAYNSKIDELRELRGMMEALKPKLQVGS